MNGCVGNRTKRRGGEPAERRGAIVVLSAVMLMVIFAFAAFSIDVGYISASKNELQTAADAAAYAGAAALGNGNSQARFQATQAAIEMAEMNSAGHGTVLTQSNTTFGNWDPDTKVFTVSNKSPTAIRVVLHRAGSSGNAVQLFFAGLIGYGAADVTASAIAMNAGGGKQLRFLVDDEFLDTDIPAIEDLATQFGGSPEDYLSDGDGDWFIDLPPGKQLELPTGQVGDPGIFDADHPAFPFGKPAKPTVADFLNYNENGGDLSKGGIDNPAVKALLDPLVGVSAVDDVAVYPSYVDPDVVHVSPVFKSDISALNPVYPENIPTQHGVPAVNALGLRRGLVAFKIIGVGSDPDGPSGSVLPNLIIEVVDPATVNLDDVAEPGEGGGSGGVKLVL